MYSAAHVEPLYCDCGKTMQMAHSVKPAHSRSCGKSGSGGKAALAVCGASFALLALAAVTAFALPGETGYDVKAGYLLDFGRFLRLTGAPPADRRPAFDICVLGHDPFGRLLDNAVANQSIDNRPVRAVHIGDAYAAKGCDIVFLSADEGDGIPLDLDAIGKADVLTVSDAEDFLKYGGMIQFEDVDDHVRFAVNLDAVNRTHITLSSELLRVASSVSGKPATEEQP